MEVRLQKALADAGVASRRACEDLITSGRVSVNGVQITTLGSKVDPENDELAVDGETVSTNKSKTYLLFNKPAGVLSTMSDPEGRPCLGDFFSDRNERLFHVGRLDKESEGLIVLTNDGEIAHRATHPSYGLVKKYLVEIEGHLSAAAAQELRSGIRLEDGLARALEVTVLREPTPKNAWIEISIHEGRYHIVRRMFEELELPVLRLIRTEFGPLNVGETKVGRWRHMNQGEIENLFTLLKLNR
ncbi:MAG: pseudouridine synthase [Actinomycetes bacterium]